MEKDFISFITENEGILYKVCRIYCKNQTDREDLFQDIIVQLWKAYPSFRGESKIQTWLYRIALNTAITSFRKIKSQQHHDFIDKNALRIPSEKNNEAQEEKKEILYYAIEQLTEIEKAIVVLHLDGYSYKETAEIIGISESNTGFKLHKIKDKLKKIVNPATYGTR